MGWARANILFDKTTRLPEPGSPMEILFLLVWRLRQNAEFQKSRSIVQALMSQKGAEGEHITKAFEQLTEAFFPYDKNQKADEIKKLKQGLKKVIQAGPLEITRMEDPRDQAKVAAKLARGQRALESRDTAVKSGQLRNLDPYDKARNRRRGAS